MSFSKFTNSDHLTNHFALEEWRKKHGNFNEKSWSFKNFLSLTFLSQIEEMKRQFGQMLFSSKFLENEDPSSSSHNKHSRDYSVICSIIGGGLYPNIAHRRVKIRRNSKFSNYKTIHGSVKLVEGSVNKNSGENGFIVYHQRQKFGNFGTFMLDASDVTPYSIVFFGDHVRVYNKDGESYLTVGEFIR